MYFDIHLESGKKLLKVLWSDFDWHLSLANTFDCPICCWCCCWCCSCVSNIAYRHAACLYSV